MMSTISISTKVSQHVGAFALGLQLITSKYAQKLNPVKDQEPKVDMAWWLQESGNRVQEEV